jgi:NAD+ diphosphatase
LRGFAVCTASWTLRRTNWLAERCSWLPHRTHQFCGRCGSQLHLKVDDLVKQCPQCDLLHYPRLAPAVIVLIRKGNEILLGRAPNWTMFSNLAGFVEPGETLEEAVHREVLEEAGITVKNLRYFGSQPWPFPHSLMIAFTAEYAGGEIRVQESELAEVRWFPLDALPTVPAPLSIARTLIDWAVNAK